MRNLKETKSLGPAQVNPTTLFVPCRTTNIVVKTYYECFIFTYFVFRDPNNSGDIDNSRTVKLLC